MDKTHKILNLRKNKRTECVRDLSSWHGGKFRALESDRLVSASQDYLQTVVWYWTAYPNSHSHSFLVYQMERTAGSSKEYIKSIHVKPWQSLMWNQDWINQWLLSMRLLGSLSLPAPFLPPGALLCRPQDSLPHLSRIGAAPPLSNLCLSPLGPWSFLLSGTFPVTFLSI